MGRHPLCATRWIVNDPTESARVTVDDTCVREQLAAGRRKLLFTTNNDIRAALDLVRNRDCPRAWRRVLIDSLSRLLVTLSLVDFLEAVTSGVEDDAVPSVDIALRRKAARRLLAVDDEDKDDNDMRQMEIVARDRVNFDNRTKLASLLL